MNPTAIKSQSEERESRARSSDPRLTFAGGRPATSTVSPSLAKEKRHKSCGRKRHLQMYFLNHKSVLKHSFAMTW